MEHFDQKLNQHQLFLLKVFIKKVGKEMRQQGTKFFKKDCNICPWKKQHFKAKQRWLSLLLLNKLIYLDNEHTYNSLTLLEREAGRETQKSLIIFQPSSGMQGQNQRKKER